MPGFLKRVSRGRNSASPSAEAQLEAKTGAGADEQPQPLQQSTSQGNASPPATQHVAAESTGSRQHTHDGALHHPYQSRHNAGYSQGRGAPDASRTSLVAQLEAAAEQQGWRHEAATSSTARSILAGKASGDQQKQQQQHSTSGTQVSSSSNLASSLPRPPFMTQAAGQSGSSDVAGSKVGDGTDRMPQSSSLSDAVAQMNLDSTQQAHSLPQGGRARSQSPRKGQLPALPSGERTDQRADDDQEQRSRPSSFYGAERPFEGDVSVDDPAAANNNPAYPGQEAEEGRPRDGANSERPRPSSFFGLEQPMGPIPTSASGVDGQTQAARFAAAHRVNREVADGINEGARSSPVSLAPSQSASQIGGQTSAGTSTRPESIAPTTSGALLDHSHLRPGEQAALLSHNKTLELYRQNAKKTNDPELIYELAVFMIDAAKTMGSDDSSGGTGPPGGSGSSNGHQGKEETAKDELVREAIALLRKVADRGHSNAQYFLGDCYANGIGTPKGKSDYDRAYPLFVLAAKHGHPDAAYRAGMSYEKGWGCRRDPSKALQFYRKAASQSHPGAMYRLGTAELNGELGLKKSAREGVKWLKRSAEAATPEFPHALHELALLHERGVDNVLYADPDYACELLAQAGEMGYAPSAYKLGVNYEYGRMGCPQDPGLSIHMYNIAAQQNHREACFALTAWYLVGAPGILPQSDTEAYLWAKKAAEQGLAKAEYSVGYFTESGIGTVRDLAEAKAWYQRAADHGDKRASQRLAAVGGLTGSANVKNIVSSTLGTSPPKNESAGAGPLTAGGSAHEQGMRIAAQQRGQPSNAPFPSAVDRNPLSPSGPATNSYPTPMVMRETQTREREHAHQMAIQRTQQMNPATPANGPAFGAPAMGSPYASLPRPNPSSPSYQSFASNSSQRELPMRPPYGNAPNPQYGAFGSPPPGQFQHASMSSPQLMPNGRPLPPVQMRQPSGSDASYAHGSGGSVSSHQSFVNGVYGNGPPGSQYSHGPASSQRHLSNAPHGSSALSPGWNGGYPTYAQGNARADSERSVPVIRQPMAPGSHGGPSGSPQYYAQHQQNQGHGQGQFDPRQGRAPPSQQPSSPTQDDESRKKSLWAQLKAM